MQLRGFAMKDNASFIGASSIGAIFIGVLIGGVIGVAMAAATHHPAVWLPLAIGVGLAVGVAIRDRNNYGKQGTSRKGVTTWHY
jgi:predicted MFS family arabinose efflux permease